jgi:lysophospholipase L1-like esterase
MNVSRGAASILASVVAAFAVCACGASSATSTGSRHPEAPGRLALDDLGGLSGCTGYGHSGIEGYGVAHSQAFLTIVCDKEVGQVLNLGIGGSTLQAELAPVLGLMPRAHARQLSIVMWGANDLALFGPGLAGYEAGLRMLVSRLRTPPANIHDATDGAFHYAGPWSQAYGEMITTRNASLTWRSPRGFPGGEVAFTATFRQGLGADYTFTLDGRPAGVWDTRALGQPLPAPAVNTPAAYRIRVPPGAGHLIRVRVTNVHGGADVLGWQLESNNPPLVVLVEHPRPAGFGIYDTGGWHFVPDDAQIEALNRAMRAVAAEFENNYVIAVDPYSAIGGNPRYFLADDFHLNPAGNRIVATEIEQAIAHNPHVRFSR